MDKDCPECKRLWEELCNATRAHFALLGETEIAVCEQNSASLKKLEPLTMWAAQRRVTARKNFKTHQEIHESGKMVRGSSAS